MIKGFCGALSGLRSSPMRVARCAGFRSCVGNLALKRAMNLCERRRHDAWVVRVKSITRRSGCVPLARQHEGGLDHHRVAGLDHDARQTAAQVRQTHIFDGERPRLLDLSGLPRKSWHIDNQAVWGLHDEGPEIGGLTQFDHDPLAIGVGTEPNPGDCQGKALLNYEKIQDKQTVRAILKQKNR